MTLPRLVDEFRPDLAKNSPIPTARTMRLSTRYKLEQRSALAGHLRALTRWLHYRPGQHGRQPRASLLIVPLSCLPPGWHRGGHYFEAAQTT